MDKVYLSIVIPCYDEMANLQKGVLDKIEHFLDRKKLTYEVIVVDDGSTDGSIEYLEKFSKENPNFKLITNSHLGKGGTVTTGVLNSKGEYVLFTDMDQATPIEEMDKLLPYFEKGFDVVIGSRSSHRKGSPWTRRIMSKGMIILRSFIVDIEGVTDTQCGFKMFSQESARKIFKKVSDLHKGFGKVSGSSVTPGFDVELLYIAQKIGYKIKGVQVDWLYVETRRVNPIKDSIDGLLDLLKIKINDYKGVYK
ncbi:MAG: glycosyltransferase [bacterium]|nr:glycosyltransferase [bacterium]